MKVKIKMLGSWITWFKGEIHEADPGVAELLIMRGLAEKYEEPPKEKPARKLKEKIFSPPAA
jgi:hypothetical protein